MKSSDCSSIVRKFPSQCDASEWLQQLKGFIDSSSGYKSIFNHLTNNEMEEFFRSCWEEKPAIFRRGHATKSVKKELESFFSSDMLKNLAKTDDYFIGEDLNAMTYVGEKRVPRDCSDLRDGRITKSFVSKTFEDGFTIQFFQPQRVSESLYFINSGFEYIFGSLAGASAYLTPAQSQGLAPHWDDVEVFVLQTEGTKDWKIWAPKEILPESYSHDIDRKDLPSSYEELTVYPGDMLYFPRGTIHEANATSELSTHITISVYQKYHMKSLLYAIFPKLIESAFAKNVDYRRGLPLQLSQKLGTFVPFRCRDDNSTAASPMAPSTISSSTSSTSMLPNDSSTSNSSLASSLSPNLWHGWKDVAGQHSKQQWRSLFCRHIGELFSRLGNAVEMSHIDQAADDIALDFVKNRLPFPDQQDPQCDIDVSSSMADGGNRPETRPMNIYGVLRIEDPHSFHVGIGSIEGVAMLYLQHCRDNDLATHMGHGRDPQELEEYEPPTYFLPVRMAPVLGRLLDSYGKTPDLTWHSLVLEMEQQHRIFPEEVDECLEYLVENKFLTISQQPSKTSSLKKRRNDVDDVVYADVGKSRNKKAMASSFGSNARDLTDRKIDDDTDEMMMMMMKKKKCKKSHSLRERVQKRG